MFSSEQHYNNFKKLEESNSVILNTNDRLNTACNYILSSDSLNQISEQVLSCENMEQVYRNIKINLSPQQKFMIRYAINLRTVGNENVQEVPVIMLSQIDILDNKDFTVLCESLSIVRDGISKIDDMLHGGLHSIKFEGKYSSLKDISLKETLIIIKGQKGYLYQSVRKLERFTRLKDLQDLKNEITSGRIHDYRGIGNKRIEVLKLLISKIEKDAIA